MREKRDNLDSWWAQRETLSIENTLTTQEYYERKLNINQKFKIEIKSYRAK